MARIHQAGSAASAPASSNCRSRSTTSRSFWSSEQPVCGRRVPLCGVACRLSGPFDDDLPLRLARTLERQAGRVGMCEAGMNQRLQLRDDAVAVGRAIGRAGERDRDPDGAGPNAIG
ncbi:MAG: hypothetical protein ACK56I_24875, partial [bacterium]